MECRASLRRDMAVWPEGSPGKAVRAALAIQEERLVVAAVAVAAVAVEAVVVEAVVVEAVAVVGNYFVLRAQIVIRRS
jgi:hypothetical protein